jgi:hypothetical protein
LAAVEAGAGAEPAAAVGVAVACGGGVAAGAGVKVATGVAAAAERRAADVASAVCAPLGAVPAERGALSPEQARVRAQAAAAAMRRVGRGIPGSSTTGTGPWASPRV